MSCAESLKYSDYIKQCEANGTEAYLECMGVVADINGVYNIYKSVINSGETFDFGLVHSVKRVDIVLDADRNALEIACKYIESGNEVSNDAISDLRKAFKKWNEKHGITFYTATDVVIDIEEEIYTLENESNDYIYSI